MAADLLAALSALQPLPTVASQWGSSYGDPNYSERDTFWGIHSSPGYDDRYGYRAHLVQTAARVERPTGAGAAWPAFLGSRSASATPATTIQAIQARVGAV